MVRETTLRYERRGARAERGARQNRYSARNVGRPARRILSEDFRDGRLPPLFRARRLSRNVPNRRRRLALERQNAFSFRQNSKRRRPYSVDGVFARRIVADRFVREQPNFRLQVLRFLTNGTDVKILLQREKGTPSPRRFPPRSSVRLGAMRRLRLRCRQRRRR